MDLGQMQARSTHDTNVDAEPRAARVGSQGDRRRAASRSARAAAAAKRRCSSSRPTSLGVAGREPHRRARASSRAAARPSPTAQLIGDKLFNVTITGSRRRQRYDPRGVAARRARSRSASTSSSARARRAIDIPAKVTGTYTYVHNIRVPGMLHGRVVRPRGQGAYGDGTAPKSLSVDESSIKHIPGVQVVRFRTTSSASSRRRSTRRSRPRRSSR